VKENEAILNKLSQKNGYKIVDAGVLEEVNVITEEQGVNCINPGHQCSVSTVKKENFFCDTHIGNTTRSQR
jgi:predicted phosphodiesterase